MAALNSTNLENVVPVRIDLTGDNALWTNVTYVQQLDLTLEAENGDPWDLTNNGALDEFGADFTWTLELRETASGAVIATGSVSADIGDTPAGDSNFDAGIVVISFPGASLTSAWANREVQWALALEANLSTLPIPIAYGKAQINSFVADPN